MANQKELVGILNAQIIEYFNLSTNFVYIGEQNKEHIKTNIMKITVNIMVIFQKLLILLIILEKILLIIQ